ncbi:MAG: (Uracil-5)-methyltransferase [Gemmatimonadetes bacterium]|nr:(Uracil-5)-methyltransferase [Gemmatimonadota bacterium]
MTVNKVADVTIERIAAGGDGIARTDDAVVVFVPRSAPGDRARVELEIRKRFARGKIVGLLEPSPQRVEPLCDHYRIDRCGGCQLQHMNYDAQLEAKRGVIRDALTRIGKRTVELPEIQPSDKQWRYRLKLTLAMRRDRRGGWIMGLHPYDDPVAVFQLVDCPITDERVMAVWKQVMAAEQHFPPAEELRASVRLLDDGASVVMEGGDKWPDREEFFAAVPAATALWWKPAHRSRSLVAERGGSSASASFAQVNATVGGLLHQYVLERTRAHRPKVVIDAYAGSGSTAIPLASDGIRVIAIEADREASARCAAALPKGSRAIGATVEEALPRSLPADVVLINPPRTGIHEQVASTLQSVAKPPRALIYVSCDPATLARDLTRMPRYRIVSMKAFDMFPQTAHVETVCELVPETA